MSPMGCDERLEPQRRKEKDERREQRKKERAERVVPEGEDPDIAGIVPGPQPLNEE